MGYGVINSDLMTTSDGVSSAGLYGFKNRLINGDMRIDQRNAGASVTITSGGVFGTDRWQAFEDTDGTMTMQQSSVSPSGFKNSLLFTTGTADASLGSSQYAIVSQVIEGFNAADLAWGTASAASVTLSFWVRSSLTGTFGGAVRNSAANRSYPFTFTINSANTWEYETITIAGDISGTWLTDNSAGIRLSFGLGVGSSLSGTSGSWAGANYVSATGATSVVGTSGATFYITGVQLEKGSTATSFDYRPYGTELALCQRYCVKYGGNNSLEYMTPYGMTYVATSNYVSSVLPVEMRAAPTVTGSTIRWTWQGGGAAITSITVENAATKVCGLVASTAGGETAYRPGVISANSSTSASLIFTAEL